jgi:hypothetical protein
MLDFRKLYFLFSSYPTEQIPHEGLAATSIFSWRGFPDFETIFPSPQPS